MCVLITKNRRIKNHLLQILYKLKSQKRNYVYLQRSKIEFCDRFKELEAVAGQGPHSGRECLARGGRSTFLILRRVRDRSIKSADHTRCLSHRQSRQQVRLVTRLLYTAAALAVHADRILIDGPPQMTADTCEEIVR